MPGYLLINRTQGLVLGFFVLVWVMLAVILAVSQAVREVTLRRVPGSGAPATLAFLVVLLAFLVRVPLAVLQLSGRMAPEGPDWYVVVQAGIGVIQVGLACAMSAGYRRTGPWGAF
jgi:uncharacterized BrkB/YihY/UPF0761 family membrane protein